MRYTRLKEENNSLKILLVLMALIVSLTLGLLLGEGEFEVEQQELKMYAEMVCLGRETNGEFGWPNFQHLEVTCFN